MTRSVILPPSFIDEGKVRTRVVRLHSQSKTLFDFSVSDTVVVGCRSTTPGRLFPQIGSRSSNPTPTLPKTPVPLTDPERWRYFYKGVQKEKLEESLGIPSDRQY